MRAKFSAKLPIVCAIISVASSAFALEVVSIPASKDNTLYEPISVDDNATSNGAGDWLFAGRVGSNPGAGETLRRALIHFDVAAVIPAGSTIVYSDLALYMDRAPSGVPPVTMSVHRVTSDWGEGASDAGSPGGAGIDAETGDATWEHAFFDTQAWTTEGGDFDPAQSANATIGTAVGVYSWKCDGTNKLIGDVQGWLDTPADNYGWILRLETDEQSDPPTLSARRFVSKDSPSAAERPNLTVAYVRSDAILIDDYEIPPQCDQ